MEIAILGGGFTGLTTAYMLAEKNHSVTIFEKEPVLGGLAVGFRQDNWNWPLEKAYHHLFATDYDIRNFAQKIGFNDIFFSSPETSSLYEVGNHDYHIYPLDTVADFLRFPLLDALSKMRAGATLVALKTTPFLSLYEKYTAEEFLKKTMGQQAWNVLWQDLFRKKFGKYAGNILASFIWARITKRTKKLGYIKGGFQTFINFIEKELVLKKVTIKKGFQIEKVDRKGKGFLVDSEYFDVVISTLPTALMVRISEKLFPKDYINNLNKLHYLHALVLIIETKKPILEKTYWLNIITPKIPIMFIGQHTNFIDKSHYGGNHIAYIGYYLERDDKLMSMSKEELFSYVAPHLETISKSSVVPLNIYLFKGPFAQPIFDHEFAQNKPNFQTPIKNFYMANLDMTYPYDRGTNYAVKLGREVATMI